MRRSKTPNKYGSRKITRDGITFDSAKEYRRYCELCLLEKAGKISDLRRQVRFELIPAQYETVETGEFYKVGDKKGQPKTKKVCVENSVVYVADFVYDIPIIGEVKAMVVEDTKGFKTKDYIIKRKLMRYIRNIKIKEV